MILGIGTDIIDITRVKKVYDKYGQTFIKRIYGKNEIDVITNKTKNNLNKLYFFLGKKFAAKEAVWKALNPNRGQGLAFKEIESLNDNNGKPYLYFSGNTKKYIETKEKELIGKLKFDISLSDDYPYGIAFVVISLAPFVKVMHKSNN